MKLKKQIQVVLGVLIPVLSIWTICTAIRAFDYRTDFSKAPAMSIQQIAQGRKTMEKRLNVLVPTSEYFQIMKDFSDLEKAAQRQEQFGDNRFELQRCGADYASLDGLERSFETSWLSEHHSSDDMVAYARSHPEVYMYSHQLPTIPNEHWKVARFWQAATFLLMAPLLLAIPLYICRIQENEGSVLLEVFNWRFVVSCIFWMYGLPYYRNMNFCSQMRRCRTVASYAVITSLSCFAAGAQTVIKKLGGEKVVERSSWSLTGSSAIISQYVGTNDKVFHAGPVQQSTFTWASSNGLYFGTFGSVPYATKHDQQEDYGFEQDFYFGLNRTIHHVTVNPDFTYVNLQPLGDMRGDPLQLSLQVARPVKFNRDTVTPYYWMNHYLPALGNSPKSGTFNRFGVNNSLQLGKWTGKLGTEAMRDNGAFSNSKAWIAKASAGVSRSIGRQLSLNVSANLATPVTHVTDGRKTEDTLSFGVVYSFAH